MRIRAANAGDAAALVPLLTELGYPSGEDAVARRLATLAADDASEVWIAERDGTVVGLVSTYVNALVTRDAPLCRITAMVVPEAQKGTGVGRALIEQVEAHARERGCDRIEVTSAERRVDAHAFYEHLGFENTSRRFIKELSVL
jgi:N-acetylglutamate synthase-like GNAT family acetyltransferase